MNPDTHAVREDVNWKTLNKIGGAAALIVMLASLADVTSAVLPGGYTSAGTVPEWFALFHTSRLNGLRDLGLLDIIVAALNVPLFFTLFAVHRRVNKPIAALAALLAFVGAAVSIATNRAFPMLVLSRDYAAAGSDSQRAILVAAGEALLAVGKHGGPGAFMGYFFINIGGATMGIVMLRGRVFTILTGWAVTLGFAILLLFNIMAAFLPRFYDSELILAGIGGIFFMAAYLLIGLKLFRLETA